MPKHPIEAAGLPDPHKMPSRSDRIAFLFVVALLFGVAIWLISDTPHIGTIVPYHEIAAHHRKITLAMFLVVAAGGSLFTGSWRTSVKEVIGVFCVCAAVGGGLTFLEDLRSRACEPMMHDFVEAPTPLAAHAYSVVDCDDGRLRGAVLNMKEPLRTKALKLLAAQEDYDDFR